MNTTNLNSTLQALINSEHDYFKAGSLNKRILAGELSSTTRFESLASGCVLHNIQQENIPKNLKNWLDDVEYEFKVVGASLCRIYFSHQTESYYQLLIDRGYKKVVEVGLLISLEEALKSSTTFNNALKPIQNHEELVLKKALYQLAKQGPDGHNMRDGSFADFEKVKNDAGYMTSYLYWKDNQPVGAVSLAIKNEFARLKNLLVHPSYRGQGIGSEMVIDLMHEAKRLGAKTFGVYAAENMNSHRLYLGCGMQEVLRQTEWSKEL